MSFGIARIRTRGRFPPSAVAIGPGVVIPVDFTLMMFAGAWFFARMVRRYQKVAPTRVGHALWIESSEPIAAGLVAGAAVAGIGDQLIRVFILRV